MIRGHDITIISRAKAGVDEYGDATWSTTEEPVHDVLSYDGTQQDSDAWPDGVTVARVYLLPRSWKFHSLRGCRIRDMDGTTLTVLGDPQPYEGGLTPTRWNLRVDTSRED